MRNRSQMYDSTIMSVRSDPPPMTGPPGGGGGGGGVYEPPGGGGGVEAGGNELIRSPYSILNV
jgi:hypothetical protein